MCSLGALAARVGGEKRQALEIAWRNDAQGDPGRRRPGRDASGPFDSLRDAGSMSISKDCNNKMIDPQGGVQLSCDLIAKPWPVHLM
jgi:hypothetical protein